MFMNLDLRTLFHIQCTRTFVVYVDSTLHVHALQWSVFIAIAEYRVREVAIFLFYCEKTIS
jgi:hypothetical protein